MEEAVDFMCFNESESTNSITDKFHKKLLLNLVIKNNWRGGRRGKGNSSMAVFILV